MDATGSTTGGHERPTSRSGDSGRTITGLPDPSSSRPTPPRPESPHGPGRAARSPRPRQRTCAVPGGEVSSARALGVMTPAAATLLLVEDDPLVRGFLADNLIADGYAVVAADTLGEGLRRLELAPPDAAIVDVGRPDGSGVELGARVRSSGAPGAGRDPGRRGGGRSGPGEEIYLVRGFD